MTVPSIIGKEMSTGTALKSARFKLKNFQYLARFCKVWVTVKIDPLFAFGSKLSLIRSISDFDLTLRNKNYDTTELRANFEPLSSNRKPKAAFCHQNAACDFFDLKLVGPQDRCLCNQPMTFSVRRQKRKISVAFPFDGVVRCSVHDYVRRVCRRDVTKWNFPAICEVNCSTLVTAEGSWGKVSHAKAAAVVFWAKFERLDAAAFLVKHQRVAAMSILKGSSILCEMQGAL